MAITIEKTAEGLNTASVVMLPTIQTEVREGLELAPLLGERWGHEIISSTALEMDDLLQPYKWQFSPNNGERFEGLDFKLQEIKIDVKWTQDDLDGFHSTWWHSFRQLGDAMMNKSFFGYLYNQHIIPKVIEEMNYLDFNGVYAAPSNNNTPEAMDGAYDGLLKVLGNTVVQHGIVPISTGAITSANAVEKFEAFLDGIPAKYKRGGGVILCSDTIATYYYRKYREDFGAGAGSADNENKGHRIDNTSVRAVPLTGMEGLDLLIFIPNGSNPYYVGRELGHPELLPQIRFQEKERTLIGLAEFKRCIGINNTFSIFVNDMDIPNPYYSS